MLTIDEECTHVIAQECIVAGKVSKYGVFSGTYFSMLVTLGLGLTAAAPAVDKGNHKKILKVGTFSSGTTTLNISNKEMEK